MCDSSKINKKIHFGETKDKKNCGKDVGSPIDSLKSCFQFLVMHQKKDSIIFYSGALLRQSA